MQNNVSDIGLTLVMGATGNQGEAVINHLLKHGHKVRAVTRDPQKPSVLTPLTKQYPGKLEIVKASYEDSASLESALSGVTGVFSVQVNSFQDDVIEKQQATTLITLAKRAGVKTFVQSTVSRAGEHESFPRWNEGYWSKPYWLPKAAIEQAVKEAGFESYTILKPVGFMDNFVPPKVPTYFPELHKGEINIVVYPETKLHLISTDDIGKFACAAFENPQKFNTKALDLVSDVLNFQEIAQILSQGLGIPVKLNALSEEEAIKSGQYPGVVRFWEWIRDVGYTADPNDLKQYGVPLTSFRDWTKENVKKI